MPGTSSPFSSPEGPGAGVPAAHGVSVRISKMPYPFKAILAICSDLDETPDWRSYREIQRFMCSHAGTVMGDGVGLEIGNSIYFDMPPGQFSYWGTDDAGREMARAYIASGHIDCLHSFGDLASRRADAERALAELERYACRLETWVDHSKAATNFGPDIMMGHGDVPDSEAYHADLTLKYGIRYVWRGRTTSMNGQDIAVSTALLAGMLNLRHPLASMRTLVKQGAKIHLGRRGDPRWEAYADNRVCRPALLRDGHKVWEFLRFNPHWCGSGAGATAEGFGELMTQRTIDAFVRRGGTGILYTHLGRIRNPEHPFTDRTQDAFRRLAVAQQRKQLRITTTHRLLRYLTARDNLSYRTERLGNTVRITLDSVNDPVFGLRTITPDDVQGITFRLPRCDRVEVQDRDGRPFKHELTQAGGESLLTMEWIPLVLPECRG